ncbi:MAG TPA: hypothetical protein VIG51_13210 [Candidatus Baltobacteraceae bacterium]|jgi:hypothetical protein
MNALVPRLCALLGLLCILQGCAPKTTALAATNRGLGLGRYHYAGKWQFVHHMADGRWNGSSARSFGVGSSVSVAFSGDRVRVYGVLGRKGGYGMLTIDRRVRNARLNFYAPAKRTSALVYSSPPLGPGDHALAIVVAGSHDRRSRGTYVNLDGVEVENTKPAVP